MIMKMKQTIAILVLSLNVLPLLADDSMSNTNTLPDLRSQASYAIGMSYGRYMQQRGIDPSLVDNEALMRGLNDAISGGQTLLTPQEMSQVLKEFMSTNQAVFAANQAKIQQKLAQENQELAAKNKAAGDAFLASNKNADGVMALPDGLQYKVITEGSGETPAMTDKVSANYSFSLMDGTQIESTATSGHPAQIPLNAPGVPHGLAEALASMKVGSVWDVWMPSDLAFGDRGMRDVPPGSALKFHIELLSIVTNTPPPAPPALTSDIIAVPSAADIKKGAKPYTLTPQQVQQMQSQAQTNSAK
jgi:FKBP-type peptidyl-prolyl cis-trans isomerase FklB